MATTDVITLDEALEAVNMTGNGARHGLKLELFVSAVSELLDSLCGPIVIRTVTEETHQQRAGLVILRKQPVVSVTSVTEYANGGGSVLTAGDLSTAGGYVLRDGGMLERRSNYVPTAWNGPVVVTYEAGRYSSTQTVGSLFKGAAQMIIARSWPQYAASWARPGGVDPGALEGGFGYFKSVQPVVEEWLPGELLPGGFG